MKLDQMVKGSTSLRKINARLVKVVGYKTGKGKDGLPTALAKTYTPKEYNLHLRLQNSRDQNKYVSSVKFIDKRMNVVVSCSCPDFVFSGAEYSLHNHGAAEIKYGNGEPPTADKPYSGGRVGLCKHLIAMRSIIKEKHGV
jgi:hypothetical protein